MTRRVLTTALLIGLVAGCALPDLQRGREALKAGDESQAAADLEPLARRGYPEARLKLARLYAQRESAQDLESAAYWYRVLYSEDPTIGPQLARVLLRIGTPEALKEAEALLVEADTRGDAAAVVGLLEIYTEHPEFDRRNQAPKLAERVAAMEGEEAEIAAIRWYRMNAAQDQRYQSELMRRCAKALERVPHCYVELARHYRTQNARKDLEELKTSVLKQHAAGTVSPEVLQRVGWILFSEELPGEPMPEAAYQLLKPASQHLTIARVRLARILVDHPHLDKDAKPEELLLSAVSRGYPEAELALGRLYLGGVGVAPNPTKAERYLREAAESLPSAHFHLGKLYKRGDLGRSDPVAAAQHFLTAARSGYPRADFALAQLFSDGRGVKVNLANAWSFAKLAAQAQDPDASALLAQIEGQMSPTDRREGDKLLRKELEIRAAALTTVATPGQGASQTEGTR